LAKKKLGCLPVVGIFILLGAIASGVSGGNNASDNALSQTSSETPKPTRTSQAQTSANQCISIRTNVTMIRNAFSEGKASPQQMSALLNSASNDWSRSAVSSSGSMKDWLNKMSELGIKLDSYILTGSPANGDVLFDQLVANMNLVDQFC
jgi:hypothetical protein